VLQDWMNTTALWIPRTTVVQNFSGRFANFMSATNTIEDVNARDDQGYLWLVVKEVARFVSNPDDIKPKSVHRKIQRWCADTQGPLNRYAVAATRTQQIELLIAKRIDGIQPDDREVWLISREGLGAIENPPKRGFPLGGTRPRKGKQTGVGQARE
jgi:hypothetical protein